jgi:hypothetical protein
MWGRGPALYKQNYFKKILRLNPKIANPKISTKCCTALSQNRPKSTPLKPFLLSKNLN